MNSFFQFLILGIRAVLRARLAILIVPICAAHGDGIPFSGEVVETNAEERVFVVRHGGMEGVAESGTLQVRVSAGDAMIDYTGRPIRGRLHPEGNGWRLESIWPMDPVSENILSQVNRRLREDTVARGRRAVRLPGEFLPDFALYDQEGRLVQTRDLRGRMLVINFIFTRCPMPEMCPANTARMARLQREMAEREWDGIQLLSFTLDPDYDTPGVLKAYAASRGIDLSNFSFLTGPPGVLEDLLRQFGILVMQEDGTIDHTMATLLVDPNGKILHRRDGSRWSVEDFLSRLENSRLVRR